MQRYFMEERPNWKKQAEQLGFIFHTMYGESYWDESRCYSFSLKEIEEDIEDPTNELHAMCMHLVDEAVRSEEMMSKLWIPQDMWDPVAQSWLNAEPHFYGRFDLAYNGTGPAKMLEYNADTPTSLYEAAFYQWIWLEENIASGKLGKNADQFNFIQESVITRLGEIFANGSNVHFASCKDTDEDRQTVKYIEDCAEQAGLKPHFVYIEDIGVDAEGRFADLEGNVIENIFKLYPLEHMFREDYGQYLKKQNGFRIVEPLWKSVLSNKGMLPLLWKMFPGHPNLLPAYFDGDKEISDLGKNYVRKPLFSREGQNVEVFIDGQVPIIEDGIYGEEGYILQAYTEMPKFGDDYMVIGSWVVGNEACGIGIREDKSLVTKDLSRFVPHFIQN